MTMGIAVVVYRAAGVSKLGDGVGEYYLYHPMSVEPLFGPLDVILREKFRSGVVRVVE